jgi:hypothetical protein
MGIAEVARPDWIRNNRAFDGICRLKSTRL